VEALKKLITDRMENAFELSVKLKIDIGWGTNWLEAH
jgi:DNA polymerase I-like protein with 3'-5' exonuclease and polymerase domains